MKIFCASRTQLLGAILIIGSVRGLAQELRPIQLPKPQTDIGRPLMQVLRDRSSGR